MALTVVPEVERFRPMNNDPLPDPPPSDVPLTTPTGDPWPRPYIIEDGLRRVAPYYYTYNTYCKQRWRDRQLLDIFASEFRDRTLEYYREAITDGRVVIDGKKVPVDYVLKNGQVISHTLHRHEPPVTGEPIKVVSEDDDMIVIDKPAGVPVHPAGRYRFNSVTEIMRAERHYAFNPLPCNRLDRLTSGVMFIGKNGVAAEEISQKLRSRTVRKEYLARVKGRFPDGDENGVTVCEENVTTVSPILGLNRVRESGKSAKTLFKRLAYCPGKAKTAPSDDHHGADAAAVPATAPALPHTEDEGYSIVHCLPLTGRTHQIRVHLQFLGHPISNDPIYANRRVFGPLLGRSESSSDNDDEIIARLSQMGKTESFASAMGSEASTKAKETQPTATAAAAAAAAAQTSTLPSDYHSDPAVIARGEDSNQSSELVAAYDALVADYQKARGEKMTGEFCKTCDTPLYSDPGPNELGIYLNAICYRDLGGPKPSSPSPDSEENNEAKTSPPDPSQSQTHPPPPFPPNKNVDAFMAGGWSYTSPIPSWALPVPSTTSNNEHPTGIRTFTRWQDSWSVGLMDFDRETVVPNGGKMKGHQ